MIRYELLFMVTVSLKGVFFTKPLLGPVRAGHITGTDSRIDVNKECVFTFVLDPTSQQLGRSI